jgi:LacI family transcriptional regulator
MNNLNTTSRTNTPRASRPSPIINLLAPALGEVYYHEMLKGVGEALHDSGCSLLLSTNNSPALSGRAAWEQEQVARLNGGGVDGCLIIGPATACFTGAERIVVIDPHIEGVAVPAVVAANHGGALQVMDYLIGLGHRRIGFIGGSDHAHSAIRRFQGYKDGLASAGLRYDPALVAAGDFTVQRGQAAAQALLALPERPTAIFAANDLMAFGVMVAARDLGLRIPQDLSVIGFDNIPETMLVSPRLTTVDQSIREMGVLGAQLLIRLIQGERPEQLRCTTPTRLIVRDSCQAIDG